MMSPLRSLSVGPLAAQRLSGAKESDACVGPENGHGAENGEAGVWRRQRERTKWTVHGSHHRVPYLLSLFTPPSLLLTQNGTGSQTASSPVGRLMLVGSVHPSVLALTSQCEVLHTVSVMGVMFPFLAHRLSWT